METLIAKKRNESQPLLKKWSPFPPSPAIIWVQQGNGILWGCVHIRDLKQSGRQRQGRLRLKNEFLPLIRISKMAACVYRLIRRHTSTSA